MELSASSDDCCAMTWLRRNKLTVIRGGANDARPDERSGFRGFDEHRRCQRQSKWRRSRSWAVFAAVWGGAAFLGLAYGGGWLPLPTAPAEANEVGGARAHFSMCFIGGGYNCVVDGDTIWLQGTKIRIADIDAPETHDPRCSSEKELGDRATLRLQQLLNGGTVTLETVDRDIDRYGRKLRIVDVDGKSVGSVLVREGLARVWDGARHPWC